MDFVRLFMKAKNLCCCLVLLGNLFVRDELGPSAVGVTLLMIEVLAVLLFLSGVCVMSSDFLESLTGLGGGEGVAAASLRGRKLFL